MKNCRAGLLQLLGYIVYFVFEMCFMVPDT